jgi:RNA polymerase sigma-70 factor (ECF subfamily)
MSAAKVLVFRGPLAKRSDAELVAACARGESDALGELFERHADALVAYLARFVPSAEVDDLVQESFLAAHRAAASYRGDASVRTWLFGIATLTARDRRRKGSRFAALRQRVAHFFGAMDELSPQRVAEGRESLARLRGAIERLPASEREVFLLCDVEELPGVEVAAALGIPTGTLYRRLHDARARLRSQLEPAVKRSER